MIYRLFIVSLLCFSGNAFSNTPIGERKVSKLLFHDSNNLYVYFTGETTHSEACQSKSTYVLPRNNPMFSQIYSGLLAAMHAKAPINGYVNGCIEIWGKTKTKITRIDLLPNE